MKWYIEKLKELKEKTPVYSVCGDDCAVCPRYVAQTEEELRETAEFWHKVGWRDHVVSNDEIKCTGCGSRETCSFMILPCAKIHNIEQCCQCTEFECKKVLETYESSRIKKNQCRKACDNEEEFNMLVRAFYGKEKNMKKLH